MSSRSTLRAARPATPRRSGRARAASVRRARWCRAGSRLEASRLDAVPSQFRNRIVQSHLREARGDSRTQPGRRLLVIANGVAQDLPHLFLSAAPVLARAALQPGLEVVVQLPDQDLSHGVDDITLSAWALAAHDPKQSGAARAAALRRAGDARRQPNDVPRREGRRYGALPSIGAAAR